MKLAWRSASTDVFEDLPMYRIELKPGEETVFRTIEELATGIRHGLITPRARIFHVASQKWLPIEFHPHYKKAMNMPATKSGETPAVVVPSAPATASIFTPKPALVQTFVPPPITAPETAPAVMAAEAVEPLVAATPGAAAPAAPAPVVESPVAVLPPLTYYEPKDVEEIPLPAPHVPLDPPDAGRFRPIHLAIAAVVLLVGSYLALSAAAPFRKSPTAVAADTQAQPSSVLPAAMQPVAQAPVAASQKNDSSPKSATSVALGASGPTFGPPASPPGARKRTIVTSIGSSPPAPAAGDSAPAIEPAPAEVDLSVPSLPLGDSLAPAAPTESSAMGRILRAVKGEGAPAPRP